MASQDDDKSHPQVRHETERNPYSSASRWRHQESSSFHRHAGQEHGQAREPVTTGTTAPLASFLNSNRAEADGDDANAAGQHQPINVAAGPGQLDDGRGQAVAPDGKDIVCGPLLNYRRMDEARWYGSVLIVAKGGGHQVLYQPSLILKRVGQARQLASAPAHGTGADQSTQFESRRLYSDPRVTFWAFDIAVPLEPDEIKYEYHVPGMRISSEHKPRVNAFFVPAADESMRLMFHSCNGFSVGTDEDAYSGAPLWNDVMRKHAHAPFHVMIGGGDQIYNDGIRVDGPLRAWTEIANPKKRRDYPFPETLRAECDDYYLQNYIRWYDSKPFAIANGQIPQLNIWDDHDIIDGFGSYVDHFMRCDVFRGIGGTAHKYYMLFQQHMAPPPSTYTSDYLDSDGEAPGPDPQQLIDTFVAEPRPDQQYIVGTEPGPYVAEHSYNIYSRLGARVALVGIDARTERTRHQVNYPETYDLIFKRLRSELGAAASSRRPIKHLILLLGIPIAYPRLTWLENVLRSPIIGPVKFLHRRFGLGGGLFNHFDGSVDLLDDLDDHYTARTHKTERAELMLQLQDIATEFSVRVTILGGDVHLAALGRFYSNPKLKVPVEEDNRYMANIISSAIVNKPPPQAVANLLARRNKIHHLNHDTDETLLDFFDKDPGDANKTANHNKCTMPSRNFATLTENSPTAPVVQANGDAPAASQDGALETFLGRNGHSQLHKGEVGAGTKHKAASSETHGRGNDGSLDICINVEINQHDPEGKTQGYGLTVPALRCETRASSTTSATSR
ncbi:transcription factor btf3 [Hirsutella rhossiliensis]|uniref:Transcription factor btf3 n=1 Tax=Hirsutella rhossiliensis TaxID=111463 RepID=A0A9P8MM06_9HYPO|nr:transcription factor btf3 [Hirsutella rhossiliensis]KAH0957489.1 transcription factor btf3 [Hirsutella rhossiliensis]